MTDKVVTGGVFYGNDGCGVIIDPLPTPEDIIGPLAELLNRRDARIAELEEAMRRAADLIDKHLYTQREKVQDAATILRAALNK